MASFTSVQSGDWNDPATWGGATYPGGTTDDDVVTIGSGHTVVYNIDNSPSGTNHRIRSITLNSGEELQFSTSMSTYLWIGGSTLTCIDAGDNGQVTLGSEGSPLSSAYTCTIEVDQSTDSNGRIIDIGNGGNCSMWGMTKTIKGYTTSAITAASSTSFTMSAVPSDWAVGDEILIQGTNSTYNVHEEEIITITSISGGDTVNWSGAATYSHLSGCMVFNLTRNIKFIATDTSSRADAGVYGSNAGVVELSYIDFNGCTNQDHGGAWSVNTQNGSGRRNLIQGCVARNQGNDGCGSPGSGTINMKDCIVLDNGGQGFDSENDAGFIMVENCYFIGNSSYGFSMARGHLQIIDSQIFGQSSIGLYVSVGSLKAINCRFFNNGDTGIEVQSGGELIHCFFGESEVGTQSNFNASKTEYRYSSFHDCYFAAGEDFQIQNNPSVLAKSSQHNQTANNYVEDYATSTQSITNDAVTYRTSSPSMLLEPGVTGNMCVFEIPLIVENGTSYTVTLYGKKDATGAWRNPEARMIGCGMDDSSIWSTEDTNWNSITLSGTASRDGVAVIYVYAWQTFNIDDVSVS